jgi:hypothetical protein
MHYYIYVANTKTRIVPKRAAIVSKLIHEEEADEIREYDGF